MGRKQHVVDLSDEERRTLEWFISTGEHKAEDITRARILLKADDGLTDATICEHFGCSIGTPYKARKNYCDRGLAAIHRRKPDREYETKLDGDAEARLIKLACSEPPEGHSRWTLHLLADELVMLDEIDFCIRVVMDQLNTHKPAAFYDFFPPEQAKAYLDRFEFHYR